MITTMRSSTLDIDEVRVVKRVFVDTELDLVLAVGAQKGWGTADGRWWGDHRILGILLQRRSQPDFVYRIAMAAGEGDCEVGILRATSKDVVLSCTPEKGEAGPNYRFIYDIRSKALVKRIQYRPFSL